MTIQTKFHGMVEVKTDQVWEFPKGLPGFEDEKSFVLLPVEGNDVFQVLQSTVSTEVALIVSNPFQLVDDYSFDIDDSTIEFLDVRKQEDIIVLGVVSLKEPFEASTINLQAPIIMQVANKKAKQMILNDQNWSLRQQIGQPVKKGEH